MLMFVSRYWVMKWRWDMDPVPLPVLYRQLPSGEIQRATADDWVTYVGSTYFAAEADYMEINSEAADLIRRTGHPCPL